MEAKFVKTGKNRRLVSSLTGRIENYGQSLNFTQRHNQRKCLNAKKHPIKTEIKALKPINQLTQSTVKQITIELNHQTRKRMTTFITSKFYFLFSLIRKAKHHKSFISFGNELIIKQ